MAAITVKLAGLEEFKQKLNPQPVLEGVDKILKAEAAWARDRVDSLTPRHSHDDHPVRGFDHASDKWFVTPNPSGTGYIIDNPLNEPGAMHNGREANDGRNWSLLLALEYGTRSHSISSKPGGPPMVFYSERYGHWVRTYGPVNHPGIREGEAAGMVRKTKVEVDTRLNAALNDLYARMAR